MDFYIILIVLIIVLIIIKKLLFPIKEDFVNIDYCPQCYGLWEGKCNSCNNCGWCIDENYNGQCMPGDKNGPYMNKFCRKWFFDGVCMDGPECGRTVSTYSRPAWLWNIPYYWNLPTNWQFPSNWWGYRRFNPHRRHYVRRYVNKPLYLNRRQFKKLRKSIRKNR